MSNLLLSSQNNYTSKPEIGKWWWSALHFCILFPSCIWRTSSIQMDRLEKKTRNIALELELSCVGPWALLYCICSAMPILLDTDGCSSLTTGSQWQTSRLFLVRPPCSYKDHCCIGLTKNSSVRFLSGRWNPSSHVLWCKPIYITATDLSCHQSISLYIS